MGLPSNSKIYKIFQLLKQVPDRLPGWLCVSADAAVVVCELILRFYDPAV